MAALPHPIARRHSGFTLVELMVVVAVIALLAALLLPVFAQARESARRAGCATHLRQIGLALRAYTDDHDGAYPMFPVTSPSASDIDEEDEPDDEDTDEPDKNEHDRKKKPGPSNWEELIQPYLGNELIFRCPTDPSPSELFDTSYALNASFVGLHESVLSYPSQTILAADRRNSLPNQSRPALFVWWYWQGNHWPPSLLPDPTPAAERDLALERHGGRFNLLFADGHVRHLRFEMTWGADRANQYWPQRP